MQEGQESQEAREAEDPSVRAWSRPWRPKSGEDRGGGPNTSKRLHRTELVSFRATAIILLQIHFLINI